MVDFEVNLTPNHHIQTPIVPYPLIVVLQLQLQI
jgi:hypothetical protein